MKDSINYFIPIVQDPMNDITGRCLTHHVSSNTYYGYQPVVVGKEGEARQQQQFSERMDTNADMDIQFNNLIEAEPDEPQPNINVRGHTNRKRTWEYDSDLPDYKKRREHDPLPFIPEQPPNNKCLHVRQPTHNIPDMPRCMMEVLQKMKVQWIKQGSGKLENNKLLEELLRETHGICSYHWQGHDI